MKTHKLLNSVVQKYKKVKLMIKELRIKNLRYEKAKT